MKIATSRGLLRWLAGHCFGPLCGLAASRHCAFACPWHGIVHSTVDTWNKISASMRSVFLVRSREHTCAHRVDVTEWRNGGRGPCASQQQADPLSRSCFRLVVIMALKERRVVAISLRILHSNRDVTSAGNPILIRHWMESATKVLVVTSTFALMAREGSRSCRLKSWARSVSALLPKRPRGPKIVTWIRTGSGMS